VVKHFAKQHDILKLTQQSSHGFHHTLSEDWEDVLSSSLEVLQIEEW